MFRSEHPGEYLWFVPSSRSADHRTTHRHVSRGDNPDHAEPKDVHARVPNRRVTRQEKAEKNGKQQALEENVNGGGMDDRDEMKGRPAPLKVTDVGEVTDGS